MRDLTCESKPLALNILPSLRTLHHSNAKSSHSNIEGFIPRTGCCTLESRSRTFTWCLHSCGSVQPVYMVITFFTSGGGSGWMLEADSSETFGAWMLDHRVRPLHIDFMRLQAFDKSGLRVDFFLSKPDPADPSRSAIVVSFSNTSAEVSCRRRIPWNVRVLVSGLIFQVRGAYLVGLSPSHSLS